MLAGQSHICTRIYWQDEGQKKFEQRISLDIWYANTIKNDL